jgi:hypothetical protein
MTAGGQLSQPAALPGHRRAQQLQQRHNCNSLAEGDKGKELPGMMVLGIMFVAWYGTNIFFNM